MKKSIVISLLTIATLFCTALYSFASTGVVTTDTLRLRKEASTDSSTIALLSVNDKVEILEDEKYGWYKVKSGEYVGYVAAQYINVLVDAKKIDKDDINKSDENTNVNANTENQENNQEEAQNNESQNENNEKETINVLTTGEKLYITPVINSLVIYTLTEEKEIEVISEVNGWSYIKIGTTTGWIRTQNIQKKEVENKQPEKNNNNSSPKVGYISGASVNFRKMPNTSSEIIETLTKNTRVEVIETGDEWAEVEYNGNKGYIATDYISDTKLETRSRGAIKRTGSKETNAETSEKAPTKETEVVTLENVTGADIVAYAKKYLGSKYVSGGSSPKGFDCSGFTTYVYKHFEISLSRTSSGQNSNGKSVAKSDMQLGDIICFSNSSGSKKIGHVGIYVGGGKFIHAANSRKGVIISNVSGDGYYFVSARRIIN